MAVEYTFPGILHTGGTWKDISNFSFRWIFIVESNIPRVDKEDVRKIYGQWEREKKVTIGTGFEPALPSLLKG